MKEQPPRMPLRERYRILVSFLIIPLGVIILVRASLAGTQAWMLIILGLAFVGLGIVRLHSYAQRGARNGFRVSRRKRA